MPNVFDMNGMLLYSDSIAEVCAAYSKTGDRDEWKKGQSNPPNHRNLGC